jgi:hypothetical protein
MNAVEKETKPMSHRYPSVRITAADVVEFSRTQGQQPSTENAERWLSLQRRCITEMMSNVVRDNLEQILGEAMLREYPDPAFDKQYKDIDEAIDTASDEYGQRMAKEWCSSSYETREMLEVVRRMLAQRDKFSACIAYSQGFGELGKSYEETVITHRTKRVHLTCEGGRVKAEVVVDDGCEHCQDVFVPEGRVD